eukprot:3590320-Rhodomonas_salina.2
MYRSGAHERGASSALMRPIVPSTIPYAAGVSLRGIPTSICTYQRNAGTMDTRVRKWYQNVRTKIAPVSSSEKLPTSGMHIPYPGTHPGTHEEGVLLLVLIKQRYSAP